MTAKTPAPARGTEPTVLTRVRLRGQRRTLWMKTRWSNLYSELDQSLAITHEEVDQILADPERLAEAEAAFYDDDPQARQLSHQIREADFQFQQDGLWQSLRERFDLSAAEVDLLALAVSMQLDPMLRRVYGYLHDDANFSQATPLLLSQFFGWSLRESFFSESNLVRWNLAQPNGWASNSSWAADPFVVNWVMHQRAIDPAIADFVQVINADASHLKSCLYPSQLADMQSFAQALTKNERDSVASPADAAAIEIELIGPAGAGKQTMAAQFSAAIGQKLVAVDGSGLTGVELALATDRAIRAARVARIERANLYWYDAAGVDQKVWRALRGYADLMLFGGAEPLARDQRSASVRKTIHLPQLSRRERGTLWSSLTSESMPEEIADWALTPAEVAGVARVAAAGPAAMIEACRQILHRAPGELFMPLVCPYTWDDIILTDSVRGHLVELLQQARLRGPVYEEWGFEKLCPLGRGITALFAGPSGTGKTMAAQVLSRALGMELYRVDLAGVMNKYIGETEKRLKLVFDSCERANVLLFFDEADALFGQRTEVKDAHDRFANIEIDYLLQRMEQFDGIAILATNRKDDLDKAFLRRLRFIVDFLQPGPAERLAIWRRALPERAPNGDKVLDEIDWQFLADKLDLTGADIKAAALAAAFLARSEGATIGMKHLVAAARREMTKHGVLLRPGDLD